MLPISDALKALEKDMNKTMYTRFVTYINMTGFVKHDKCITRFFMLPIENRDKFLDFSKSQWNSDSTKKNAISAVSSALDVSIIKDQFDPKQHKQIKTALQDFMASFGNVSKPTQAQTQEIVPSKPEQDTTLETTVNVIENPIENNDKPTMDIKLDDADDQNSIENSENEDYCDHTDFALVDRMNVIHKEVQQYGSNLANISKFASFVQDQNRVLEDKIKQVELERDQLKEENKSLIKQLALSSKSNNTLAVITSLQYSIDILLALYKDSCPSLKTYEAFEAIVRKQIDNQAQLVQPSTTSTKASKDHPSS